MVVDGRVQQEIPAVEGVQTLLREVEAVVEPKAVVEVKAENKNILKYTFIFFILIERITQSPPLYLYMA
jgi:hypothetical protein